MTKINKSVIAIGIALMLLVTIAMPTMGAEPARPDKETKTVSSAKTSTGSSGQEKVSVLPQFAWVTYGPINPSTSGQYYYVPYGGALSGTPTVVTGIKIPYTYPNYAKQKVTTNTESNYGNNQYQYVHVNSVDGKSLAGSYITLIGIY